MGAPLSGQNSQVSVDREPCEGEQRHRMGEERIERRGLDSVARGAPTEQIAACLDGLVPGCDGPLEPGRVDPGCLGEAGHSWRRPDAFSGRGLPPPRVGVPLRNERRAVEQRLLVQDRPHLPPRLLEQRALANVRAWVVFGHIALAPLVHVDLARRPIRRIEVRERAPPIGPPRARLLLNATDGAEVVICTRDQGAVATRHLQAVARR